MDTSPSMIGAIVTVVFFMSEKTIKARKKRTKKKNQKMTNLMN